MSVSFVLVVVMGVLFAAGVYAMLERSLTRVLFGFLLLGNAVNLLLLITVGNPGVAPFYDDETGEQRISDPLPMALGLTAIVITFAITAFLLALIYRSWQLGQADIVEDDETDLALRERAAEPDESMDDEADETEDEISTDFVGDELTTPITVLHHRDISALRDDAGVDHGQGARAAASDRTAASDPPPAPADNDDETTRGGRQ